MGALWSSLAACLDAGDADANGSRALGATAGDGPDASERTRQEHAATVIASFTKNRMGGKALVGKSVRIAASAESAARRSAATVAARARSTATVKHVL